MGGAMAQIRPEGAPIQSSDPPLLTGNTVGSGEDRMEHAIELMDPVPQTPHDSPLLGGHIPGSDEGSMILKELTDLCFHPFRAGTSRRHSLGRRKVSKQERKNLKSQQKIQDIDDLVDEEVIVEDKGSGEKRGSIAETVNTARLDISTARPDISAARPEVSTAELKTPPITTDLFDDEDITIADTLIKMKSQKAKEKGIAFKDADDSTRPIRSITTLQPLPTIDPKDKDLDEEVRTERERQEKAAKAALAKLYDEVQSQIDADQELAARLTYEEQEKHTVEERMLEVLDRQDVLDLHKIVMERFPANNPEGYDLILWEDLKTLMESSEDDEIWKNQQDWKLLS
nr:hypothetical protein [Tanacetum cinerariifolium]